MRATVLLFFNILALPLLAYGQSTLSFPRAIQPSELNTTGFAVVNPATANATVTFTLYRFDGAVERVSTRTIPARGQLARTGGELFPGAANAGWVEATSESSGLQGFWIAGDFATFTDGADAATSSPELVVPLATAESELHVANTGTANVTMLIQLYGEDGFELAMSEVRVIPPKGFFKTELAALFPFANLTLARHVRLRCVNPFAALLIARNFLAGPSWAVVNAVPASMSSLTMKFPHAVDGLSAPGNYLSVLGITNLSSFPNDVTITFSGDRGAPLQIQLTIKPNGALRDSLRSLFGWPAGFQSGWVAVYGTLPLTGFVAYADTVAKGVAVVPAQVEPQTNLLFAHIADLPPWWTGLALLNADSTRQAKIDLFALSPAGEVIGSTTFVLGPGTRISKLLSEWIPQTQARTSDGGFVFVRSDIPLYGIELFFSRDLKILSNVAAGRILPGIRYMPPE